MKYLVKYNNSSTDERFAYYHPQGYWTGCVTSLFLSGQSQDWYKKLIPHSLEKAMYITTIEKFNYISKPKIIVYE